jgi:aquaporin Z
LVQVVAAIFASLVVAVVIGADNTSEVGLTLPLTGWLPSLIIEIILTFILMFTSLSLKEDVGFKAFGGVAIGAAIIALRVVGLHISGASMNPARSLGPAVVAQNFSDQWIYWLAPIVGAVAAVLAFQMIKDTKTKKSPRQQ